MSNLNILTSVLQLFVKKQYITDTFEASLVLFLLLPRGDCISCLFNMYLHTHTHIYVCLHIITFYKCTCLNTYCIKIYLYYINIQYVFISIIHYICIYYIYNTKGNTVVSFYILNIYVNGILFSISFDNLLFLLSILFLRGRVLSPWRKNNCHQYLFIQHISFYTNINIILGIPTVYLVWITLYDQAFLNSTRRITEVLFRAQSKRPLWQKWGTSPFKDELFFCFHLNKIFWIASNVNFRNNILVA